MGAGNENRFTNQGQWEMAGLFLGGSTTKFKCMSGCFGKQVARPRLYLDEIGGAGIGRFRSSRFDVRVLADIKRDAHKSRGTEERRKVGSADSGPHVGHRIARNGWYWIFHLKLALTGQLKMNSWDSYFVILLVGSRWFS